VIGAWYFDKAAREGQSFSEDDQILWKWMEVVHRGPFRKTQADPEPSTAV
jgi:hypothetical protein